MISIQLDTFHICLLRVYTNIYLHSVELRPAERDDSALGMAGPSVSGRQAPHLIFQASSLDVQLRGQDQRERDEGTV